MATVETAGRPRLRRAGRSGDPALRILALSPFPPRLDAVHGGARVVAHLLDHLGSRHDVALLCLRGPQDDELDGRLRDRLVSAEEIRHGSENAAATARIREVVADYAGLAAGTPSWVRALRSHAFDVRVRDVTATWRPDVLHVDFSVMGQYVSAPGHCRRPPAVLVEHDVAHAAASELHGIRRGLAALRPRAEALAWKRFERRLLARVDGVAVFTQRDARALRVLDAAADVSVIPLGVDVPAEPLDPIGVNPPTVVFVGSFVHEPNVDAAIRLVHDVLPRLRDTMPELVVEIVGQAPPTEVQALAGLRVAVHGDVPDVTPFLERAAVVAVPIRLGGGMRVKVLESLAAGKAVVASPRAVEGLPVVDDEHLLVADGDDAFAAAIGRLVRDPALRAALGASARAWAAEHLPWARSAEMFEALYARVITESRPSARTS
jgi:polysaccharide biosynthesis protein PslH